MNALKSQPTPVKVAIAGGVAVILFALVLIFALGGDSKVTVLTSTKAREISASMWKLEAAGIDATVAEVNDSTFEVRVLDADAQDAKLALRGDDIGVRLNGKVKGDCPKPNALAGNRAYETYEQCELLKQVQDVLMNTPGVLQAKAKVNTKENEGITGADTITTVTAQIYKDRGDTQINASALAMTLGKMVGGSSEDVVLIDADTGDPLWSGGTTGGSGTGADECAMPEQDTIDITVKEKFLRCDIKRDLTEEIEEIVGRGNAKVSAYVQLSPEARTVSRQELLQGALVSQDVQRDGSNLNENKSYQPGTRNTTSSMSAGYVQRMSIAVVLNQETSTPALERAVDRLVGTYITTNRGDTKSVTAVKFPEPVAAAGSEETEAEAASASESSIKEELDATATRSTHVPGWALALLFVTGVGFVASIAILWRRNARLASERRRFEDEFRHEQRMFQQFAQENPDDVARQLEQLLGAPAVRQ